MMSNAVAEMSESIHEPYKEGILLSTRKARETLLKLEKQREASTEPHLAARGLPTALSL